MLYLMCFLTGCLVTLEVVKQINKRQYVPVRNEPLVSIIKSEMTAEEKEERRIKNSEVWHDHINKLKTEHN